MLYNLQALKQLLHTLSCFEVKTQKEHPTDHKCFLLNGCFKSLTDGK